MKRGLQVSSKKQIPPLRSGAVRRAGSRGRSVRGRDDQHLCAAGVAAGDCGCSQGAAALDGVLDLLGDWCGGLGGGGEYSGSASGSGTRSCGCALSEITHHRRHVPDADGCTAPTLRRSRICLKESCHAPKLFGLVRLPIPADPSARARHRKFPTQFVRK